MRILLLKHHFPSLLLLLINLVKLLDQVLHRDGNIQKINTRNNVQLLLCELGRYIEPSLGKAQGDCPSQVQHKQKFIKLNTKPIHVRRDIDPLAFGQPPDDGDLVEWAEPTVLEDTHFAIKPPTVVVVATI
uniref:Secreted protein n=1 Tax=Triticum urartu TaxID=4572 RepID=A0A8R7TJM6_TRIUA